MSPDENDIQGLPVVRVAELLNCVPGTVYAMLRDGRLSRIGDGRPVLIEIGSLVNMVVDQYHYQDRFGIDRHLSFWATATLDYARKLAHAAHDLGKPGQEVAGVVFDGDKITVDLYAWSRNVAAAVRRRIDND